jgi:ADP-ribose pyrophosphatase YjhB (NUDIX family)
MDENSTMKRSVAVVVRREGDRRFLAVRRPDDDEDLPGIWGLPAASLRPDESLTQAAVRVGREKLGVELRVGRIVGELTAARTSGRLTLTDVEATIVAGDPDVTLSTSDATRYVEQRWVDDVEVLRDGADRSSLCCRILVDAWDRGALPERP